MSSRVLRILKRRLLQAIVTILGIVIINFFLLHLMPGDIADVLAGQAGSATPEFLAELRARFLLDQPLHTQLFAYLLNLVQLDLGHSFYHSKPVLDLILERLMATLLLLSVSIGLAAAIGIVLGTYAAEKRNTLIDYVVAAASLLFYSTPVFLFGLCFILIFSVKLGWLPASGMQTIGAGYEGLDRVLDIAKHMILPVATYTLFYIAIYTRLMRASVLEVDRLDYVRTAKAKGLSERTVLWRHKVRTALIPIVTMIGLQFGTILGGSVVVETIFAWPGLGYLSFEAIFKRDVNLLLGILLFSSIVVIVVNIILDLLYTVIDPRVDIK